MSYETFLFEDDEAEEKKQRTRRSISWPWHRKRVEKKQEENSMKSMLSGFYAGNTSLLEEEEAERTVEKSLMKRLQENPFTWYDYLIFLIEAGLFILLVLALLGRIPFI